MLQGYGLKAGSPEDTLQSLGCTSGEVVFKAVRSSESHLNTERGMNGAEVPSEAKAREEGMEAKTEAKARPRFDSFVPLLLTPVFFGGAFGPAVGPDFARHRLQQSALQWLPCQYHAVQGEKCR